MKQHLPSNDKASFQDIPVVLSGQFDQRHMRKYLKKTVAETTVDQEVKSTLQEIANTYTSALIKYITSYFISGQNPSRINTALPSWIALSRDAFDFTTEAQHREESFTKLMHTMIQPFTEGEMEVGAFQYSMLLARAKTLMEEDAKESAAPQSLKSLIYRLCTSPKLYVGCELAITVMLYNLCCSTSECGIESMISAIGANNSKDRPLGLSQLQSEIMIRKNGPHPLHHKTTEFLINALTSHFGGGPGKWTFVRRVNEVEVSRVIKRHMKSVPEPKLSW